MSALARIEAREAAEAADALRAVFADLQRFGSLTRETIRRVRTAVTQSAAAPPGSSQVAGQQPALASSGAGAGEEKCS